MKSHVSYLDLLQSHCALSLLLSLSKLFYILRTNSVGSFQLLRLGLMKCCADRYNILPTMICQIWCGDKHVCLVKAVAEGLSERVNKLHECVWLGFTLSLALFLHSPL